MKHPTHIETYINNGGKACQYYEALGMGKGRIFVANNANTAQLFEYEWANKQAWASCLTLEYAFGDIEDLPAASVYVPIRNEWKEISRKDLAEDARFELEQSEMNQR